MVGYTVIGAGLAGLSLATELRRLGVEVEVIEYRDYVGGIHAMVPEVRGGIINGMISEVGVRLEQRPLGPAVQYTWFGGGGGYRKLGNNVLVATGFRVMTMPELGIYGGESPRVFTHIMQYWTCCTTTYYLVKTW
ncbi:NAD(P)/FAD-dependent oxidoreductase [Vulcanisaeta distributa]|uniref:NAD(P)-binding protein n=1 Tax=Vulcanisaeta distributa TaxID=164451 RepID=UPI0006D13D45|nr:FAD/NAD(P)-binding protein [Vulcanisaeta distributa]